MNKPFSLVKNKEDFLRLGYEYVLMYRHEKDAKIWHVSEQIEWGTKRIDEPKEYPCLVWFFHNEEYCGGDDAFWIRVEIIYKEDIEKWSEELNYKERI